MLEKGPRNPLPELRFSACRACLLTRIELFFRVALPTICVCTRLVFCSSVPSFNRKIGAYPLLPDHVCMRGVVLHSCLRWPFQRCNRCPARHLRQPLPPRRGPQHNGQWPHWPPRHCHSLCEPQQRSWPFILFCELPRALMGPSFLFAQATPMLQSLPS